MIKSLFNKKKVTENIEINKVKTKEFNIVLFCVFLELKKTNDCPIPRLSMILQVDSVKAIKLIFPNPSAPSSRPIKTL
jgi:hypothetical protein